MLVIYPTYKFPQPAGVNLKNNLYNSHFPRQRFGHVKKKTEP